MGLAGLQIAKSDYVDDMLENYEPHHDHYDGGADHEIIHDPDVLDRG